MCRSFDRQDAKKAKDCRGIIDRIRAGENLGRLGFLAVDIGGTAVAPPGPMNNLRRVLPWAMPALALSLSLFWFLWLSRATCSDTPCGIFVAILLAAGLIPLALTLPGPAFLLAQRRYGDPWPSRLVWLWRGWCVTSGLAVVWSLGLLVVAISDAL